MSRLQTQRGSCGPVRLKKLDLDTQTEEMDRSNIGFGFSASPVSRFTSLNPKSPHCDKQIN